MLEEPLAKKGDFMKKKVDELEDELRPEYDFSKMAGGIRGKYVERYRSGTNLILLDPDIAQAFPTDVSVNEALRLLLQIAQRQPHNNPDGADWREISMRMQKSKAALSRNVKRPQFQPTVLFSQISNRDTRRAKSTAWI